MMHLIVCFQAAGLALLCMSMTPLKCRFQRQSSSMTLYPSVELLHSVDLTLLHIYVSGFEPHLVLSFCFSTLPAQAILSRLEDSCVFLSFSGIWSNRGCSVASR